MINYHQDLMEQEWTIVHVGFLWDLIKKLAINVKERIQFIWKVKLLKSKRKKGSLETIGMYFLEKSCIHINAKVSPNTKICKVWQVCLLKVKRKKNQKMVLFFIHLCLFFQTKEEFTILKQKKKGTNGLVKLNKLLVMQIYTIFMN